MLQYNIMVFWFSWYLVPCFSGFLVSFDTLDFKSGQHPDSSIPGFLISRNLGFLNLTSSSWHYDDIIIIIMTFCLHPDVPPVRLGDDPLAASSGQVVVGTENKWGYNACPPPNPHPPPPSPLPIFSFPTFWRKKQRGKIGWLLAALPLRVCCKCIPSVGSVFPHSLILTFNPPPHCWCHPSMALTPSPHVANIIPLWC